ncbi:hypothetical protein BC834DRAFT_683471 [Gloeopeniophorella convolvens]|nr:hypothetical protein BC834DRAFT_683471 [Gloeopeniophorella convolvens]
MSSEIRSRGPPNCPFADIEMPGRTRTKSVTPRRRKYAKLPNPIHTHYDNTPSSPPIHSAAPSSSSTAAAFDDTVIPPDHDARTLVLCFDGTGDQFDADNSNIVQFFSMLKKDNKNEQLVYYQAGIGTYTIPQIATPWMAKLEKTIDAAIANHLDAHVMSGYEFLMENYRAEDKICIFGFSRGAYTARALAGMIYKVGLLPAGNHQQVPFAYKMFSRDDDVGWRQSKVFKRAFSVDVEIEFLGVWDTVASVGCFPRHLPFTTSNHAVRFFRHAISLDERRGRFKANHWQVLHPDDQKKGTQLGEMPRSNQRHPHYHTAREHKGKRKGFNSSWQTSVKEVWFAGCHCDVGGGSVKNGTRYSLARIPLRWMVRECFRAGTGIQFHRDSFKEIGIDPSSLYHTLTTRPPPLPPTQKWFDKANEATHASECNDGTMTHCVLASDDAAATFVSEEEEEVVDALMPIYDMLSIYKCWWILEILPLRYRLQNAKESTWYHEWMMNMGQAREIPPPDAGEKILVHRSVQIRMAAEGLKGGIYEPKAQFQHLPVEWVD